MRPIETLLLLINLLTFFVLTIPRLRVVRWTGYVAVIGLLIAGVQAGVEGPRWAMVPAYALSVLFFLVWLLQNFALADRPARRSWTNRLAAGLAIGLGVLGLVMALALPILFPVFNLPQPSGPYAIGTLTYHWEDKARPEIFTNDANDHRELMVQIWYPAKEDSAAPRARYVSDPRVFKALLGLLHMPGFLFDQFKYVKTHAIPAAPVMTAESAYPVLIFASGRGGFRQESTVMFEELVAHGYIVAAIDQPYASTGVEFPDGRLVTLDDRLLPGPTGGLPADRKFFDDVVIPYLAKDVVFTLDQLTGLNQADPHGVLTGRIDVQRAGIFGPSLGGLIGAEACYLDPRLKVLLAMDVHMPADAVHAGLKQPTMFITRDAKWMRREGWNQAYIDELQTSIRTIYERLPGDGYLVLVPGMFHDNFSDAALYSPLMPWLGVIGPINGERANSILSAYTLAFFDKHLKGQQTLLLDGPSDEYPEVHFETRRS